MILRMCVLFLFLLYFPIYSFNALANIGTQALKVDEKELFSQTKQKLSTLSQFDLDKKESVFSLEQKQALKRIAFDSTVDLQIRWRALVLAAKYFGNGVQPEIQSAFKSSEWFMRSASMMAARNISETEALNLARKLVNDKALVVRSAAVEVLGGSTELSDRRLLWSIIQNPANVRKGQSLWIRSQALQILTKSPLKTESSQFIAVLKETDLELQAIAIHGLEKLSDFQFGLTDESIGEHRKRWLNWWSSTGSQSVSL